MFNKIATLISEGINKNLAPLEYSNKYSPVKKFY